MLYAICEFKIASTLIIQKLKGYYQVVKIFKLINELFDEATYEFLLRFVGYILINNKKFLNIS